MNENEKDLETMRAVNLATQIYDGLKREGSGLPYITHSFGVFLIVRQYTSDVNVQVAGLFHDFFKKRIPKKGSTSGEIYTYDDLTHLVGIPAARLVDEISHYRDAGLQAPGDWRQAKYQALAEFSQLSPGAKIIFVANQIHNLFSLVEDYKSHKTKVWEIFEASEEMMAVYYADIMQTVIGGFRHPMIEAYYHVFREACQLFGWNLIYDKGTKGLVWAKTLADN